MRDSHRSPDFAQTCLEAWREVIAACAENPWILEGVAFQSTVRFMFEQNWPESEIAAYWEQFTRIVASVDTLLVHLHPQDVEPSCENTP